MSRLMAQYLTFMLVSVACWSNAGNALAQPPGMQWGTINPFTPKVNGQPGTVYNPNNVLNIQSGASGTNPTAVAMRVVFRVIIQSPPPNATIVAEKTRAMIVQSGQQFVFQSEELDPFNVGNNPPANFFGSATLHMEEIGPEPALIPGDSKSVTFTRN